MKKGKISVTTNDTSISMSKSIGMPYAIAAGLAVGLGVAKLVYAVYRQGVGSGVQSMLETCDCCEASDESAE